MGYELSRSPFSRTPFCLSLVEQMRVELQAITDDLEEIASNAESAKVDSSGLKALAKQLQAAVGGSDPPVLTRATKTEDNLPIMAD